MAVEQRRGCGFRKVGGLYLVAAGGGMPCGRLPIPLEICPTCSSGIKQTRGWTWIDLPGLVKGLKLTCQATIAECMGCPMNYDNVERIGRAGLLWIGEQFYPTPAHFIAECDSQGISRRVKAVPRGFKLGESWVLLGHPKTVRKDDPDSVAGFKWVPGIFRVFKPERIEKLITETQSKDPVLMAELEEKGLTAVIVPDNDRDHQGSVYDAEDEEPVAATTVQ